MFFQSVLRLEIEKRCILLYIAKFVWIKPTEVSTQRISIFNNRFFQKEINCILNNRERILSNKQIMHPMSYDFFHKEKRRFYLKRKTYTRKDLNCVKRFKEVVWIPSCKDIKETKIANFMQVIYIKIYVCKSLRKSFWNK